MNLDFLNGGGPTGALIRSYDWGKSALGLPDTWPAALRTLVGVMLGSNQPMFVTWGPERTLLYNEGYAGILGRKHPGALGQPLLTVWSEIRDGLRALVERVEAGESVHMDNISWVLERHGYPEEAHFAFSYTPVRDETGQVAGLFCPCVETTQQVLAERRTVAEREWLGRLFDQAPGFMAMLGGPEHVFELVNPAYSQLIGHRDVVGKPVRQALPEIEGQGFFELLDRVYATGQPFNGSAVQIGLQRTPGAAVEGRFLDFVYQPVIGADGAVLGIFVEGSDVTDRVQSEALLRESEERLRISQEAGGIGTFELLPETGEIVVSGQFCRLWGVPPVSRTSVSRFLDLIHPDDRAAVMTGRSELPERALEYTEYRIIRPDTGETRWMARRGEAVVDPAGGGPRYFGVSFDITARKEAEAELRSLNETLEARVAEALAERSQIEEALRQSQKMEAVGQLTGGIAHDFNNLLAGIVGSLDLMQTRIRQGRTAEIDRYVTAAMTSAQRAAALTHRLLAFSRRAPLDPKPVEANKLVAGMDELLRRTLGPEISLEMVLAGGLWCTLCDPVQLESALLNLCINARDAMPEGGRLTIETSNAHLDDAYSAGQHDVTPGQYVAISVTDTGTGMSPEVIARVFDPFFTTKPIGQGTGLGLSMVYGFAKQSEGHARVYSEEGRGTTVRLYLPRHQGAAEVEGEAQITAEAPRAEAGETVLVVEDEPVVRNLIVEVLQDLGYRAMEAVDGPSGLKVLQSRRRIDLLVTDVGLPGINGRQLADQARERRPDLKVLFITGYAENATLANGFLEPGMEMVTKPFAIDALAQRIRQMIEGRLQDDGHGSRRGGSSL